MPIHYHSLYLPSTSNIHQLKTVQPYFDMLDRGEKLFELRKNDRGYMVGDILILQEYIPSEDDYTGRLIIAQVTSCIAGDWLAPDHVALGIRILN